MCRVRDGTLGSFISNHKVWDWSLQNLKDTSMKARINGVKAVMTTFSFFFGCALRQTDKLSKSKFDCSGRLGSCKGCYQNSGKRS